MNTPASTWILGGTHRRETTLPLLAAVKPRVIQGSPIVWIDTAPRSLVWSHLEMWALKAGRELDVRRVDIDPRNAENFVLDLEDVESTRAIVYVAVHLRDADHDVEEALQELLAQVAHVANQKRSHIAEPLVVVLQDADAMPGPVLRQLSRGTSVHTYLASRRLSPLQSAAVRDALIAHEHHVLILLQGFAERCEGLLNILQGDGLRMPHVALSRRDSAWVVTGKECFPEPLELRAPPEVENVP